MQALQNVIRRKLVRVREYLKALEQKRARSRRRRQRVIDWEKSIERGSRRRGAATDAQKAERKHASCAFCGAIRGWMTGQWRRLAQAVVSIGRGFAGFAGRIGQFLHFDAIEKPSRESARVFHRRSYPGSRSRRFELHVPDGHRDDSTMPLLMVLHGCHQTSADIRCISNFDTIADREGFIAVYPFVTGYSGMRIRNCWGWWLDREIRPGAGEVEDLWQIVEQVREEVSIDDRRIHIAGLSSGGAMAVAAMVAHFDKIASGAAVAGVPYSETTRAISYGASSGAAFKPAEQVASAMKSIMGEHGRPSPIFIVHSSDDPIVEIQAARNIRDSWAACYGMDVTRPASESSGSEAGAPWVHRRYRQTRKRSAIETLFIESRGHGWYGGNPGKYSYPAAPDTSELMWRFFKRHPLDSELRGAGKRPQMRKAS